jgi:hypothetical protein
VAHDDVRARAPRLRDEVAERGVQLRRAARDVERRRAEPPHGVDHLPGRLAAHDLRALRAGVDVAVFARLVAELADVDLQGLDGGGGAQLQPVRGQLFLETDGGGRRRRRPLTRDGQSFRHHIETLPTELCAWSPWMSAAPPRRAEAM